MINAGLTLDTITSAHEFDALAGEWDVLVRAMPRPSPFMVHGWLSTWWRYYGAGAELTVHVARSGERLVAAVPLFVRPRGGLRVARFLGGDQSALADMLVAPGAPADTPHRLADHVAAGEQDFADLFGMPRDSRLAAALGPSRLRLLERVESPILDISDGWGAAYRAKTTSKKRNFHQRRRRQLSELGKIEIDVARREEELVPALQEAFRLHRLRWEGRPDGSRFATPVGVEFHTAAIRALSRLEMPRIVTLKLDGKAIAFHYYFAFCERMYVHRLAFDPQYARCSPGLVNTLDALESASGEGLKLVEFLGADERYKVELADRFEPMHQGFGVAGTLGGRAAAAALLRAVQLRRTLKRTPGVQRLYSKGMMGVTRILPRS